MTIKDLLAAGISPDAEIFIGHYNDGQKRVSMYEPARIVQGSAFGSIRDAEKVVHVDDLHFEYDNADVAVILHPERE
jgi:hypothetical protein